MAFADVGGCSVGVLLLVFFHFGLELLLHVFQLRLILLVERFELGLYGFCLGHGLHNRSVVEVRKLLCAETERCCEEHDEQ